MKAEINRQGNAGLSRTDLLAVMATVALLLGLLLSMGAGTRQASELVLCRSNLRQQGQAWQAYALDHSDQVVGSGLDVFNMGEHWAVGTVSWDPSGSVTNSLNVQVPAYVPYIGRDPRVFRCPSDRYLSAVQVKHGWSFRVRSYSMNGYFGSQGQGIGTMRQFERLTDVPRPAGYFVLVEEHPDSINDPNFFTTFGSPSGWVDLPAAFHERSANFLFADSHVETHEWKSERTLIPVRFLFSSPSPSPKDPDFRWTFERTSLNGR